MIVSFGTKDTREFYEGQRVKRFESIRRPAQAKLDRLHVAGSLAELACLPGNRFEALKGDRAGQYSIRINDQWRVCFTWDDGEPGPAAVEIVDYH
jgi:proteic killer suppression protein